MTFVTASWCLELRNYHCSMHFGSCPDLIGGLEHFLFSHILGILIPVD